MKNISADAARFRRRRLRRTAEGARGTLDAHRDLIPAAGGTSVPPPLFGGAGRFVWFAARRRFESAAKTD